MIIDVSCLPLFLSQQCGPRNIFFFVNVLRLFGQPKDVVVKDTGSCGFFFNSSLLNAPPCVLMSYTLITYITALLLSGTILELLILQVQLFCRCALKCIVIIYYMRVLVILNVCEFTHFMLISGYIGCSSTSAQVLDNFSNIIIVNYIRFV